MKNATNYDRVVPYVCPEMIRKTAVQQ